MIRETELIVTHDATDDCVACHAQPFVQMTLVPAVVTWEPRAELPRFSIALHGAAGLLGSMLEDGIPRHEFEAALSDLLDEMEQESAEDRTMSGPPQGTALLMGNQSIGFWSRSARATCFSSPASIARHDRRAISSTRWPWSRTKAPDSDPCGTAGQIRRHRTVA